MVQTINIELDKIGDLQLLKECLELRLALIGQNNSNKSEYQKNEDDILVIKTKIEIKKLQAVIDQKIYDVIENIRMFELETKMTEKE